VKLIDTITVTFGSDIRRIELLLGDLTQIPEEQRVDAIIVSAFPYDYAPTTGSLIGALHRSGLSVQALARDPYADLRSNFSCWLSREIAPSIAGLSFRHLLCFELLARGTPPETVSDIFQALAPFAYAEPAIRSVAMPVVATGDQGYSISTMLPPLLTAAKNWLTIGFPLRTIKLVVRSEGALAEAIPIFKRYQEPGSPTGPQAGTQGQDRSSHAAAYDVFVSYSRQDEGAAQHLATRLKQSGLTVFIDRSEIDVGSSWQQKIFDALESCQVTVALYSPGFVESKVCKEEFNISWARGREEGRSMIFPLLVRDASLPTYMKLLNYIDCRVSDHGKIASAASALATNLHSSKTLSS
jgi:hypothetical protein